MLALYLLSLVVGGGLLLLALLGGGEGEVGGEALDLEPELAGSGSEPSSWASALPLLSLFFWTFFLAFFGLTGLLLTWLAPGPGAVLTAVLAAGVGVAAGWAAQRLISSMARRTVDSSVGPAELIGRLAQVVVPIARGELGKVRLEVGGRQVELLARAESPGTLASLTLVWIAEVLEDGTLRVEEVEAASNEPPLRLPPAPQEEARWS
jgi:membrane protein implicated in regulation of membrane protease activity